MVEHPEDRFFHDEAHIIVYYRQGNVVKAEGDAYIADKSDPGKLKLRFSNCEYRKKSKQIRTPETLL